MVKNIEKSPRDKLRDDIGTDSETAVYVSQPLINTTTNMEHNKEFSLHESYSAATVLENLFQTPRPTPSKPPRESAAKYFMMGKSKTIPLQSLEKQMSSHSLQNRSSNRRKELTHKMTAPILVKYDAALKVYPLPPYDSEFIGPYVAMPRFTASERATTHSKNSQVLFLQAQIHHLEGQRMRLQQTLDETADSMEHRLTSTLREAVMILDNRRGYKTEMIWILARIKQLRNQLAAVACEMDIENGSLNANMQSLDLSEDSFTFSDDPQDSTPPKSEKDTEPTRASKPLPPLPFQFTAGPSPSPRSNHQRLPIIKEPPLPPTYEERLQTIISASYAFESWLALENSAIQNNDTLTLLGMSILEKENDVAFYQGERNHNIQKLEEAESKREGIVGRRNRQEGIDFEIETARLAICVKEAEAKVRELNKEIEILKLREAEKVREIYGGVVEDGEVGSFI